jgi:hypothetical protein
MTYRVTAFVHKDDGKRGNTIGRVTFQTSDYDAASHFARNIPLPPDCDANVDFEMSVPICRRVVWVDANVYAMEQAATCLLEAAERIKNNAGKRKVLDPIAAE